MRWRLAVSRDGIFRRLVNLLVVGHYRTRRSLGTGSRGIRQHALRADPIAGQEETRRILHSSRTALTSYFEARKVVRNYHARQALPFNFYRSPTRLQQV